MPRLPKTKHKPGKPEKMKKKLTLLIFLFPAIIMAQEVKNGGLIFDLGKNKRDKQHIQDSIDRVQDSLKMNQPMIPEEDETQRAQKEKKQKREQSSSVQDDWKRNGLFKALFHVGINGAQIDGDNYAGYDQIGLDAGVGTFIRVHKYLAFTMSIDYSMKGARQHLVQDPNNPSPSQYQVQWDYLEVPLMLHVVGKNLVTFGMGLQPAVMVRYREWDQYGNRRDVNTPLYPAPGGMPNLFDLEGIAALHFIVWKRVLLGIKFSYSLTRVRSSLYATPFNGEYNNLLTFEAGYLLDMVKKKNK